MDELEKNLRRIDQNLAEEDLTIDPMRLATAIIFSDLPLKPAKRIMLVRQEFGGEFSAAVVVYDRDRANPYGDEVGSRTVTGLPLRDRPMVNARTLADRRADCRKVLLKQPDLSDRAVARLARVSTLIAKNTRAALVREKLIPDFPARSAIDGRINPSRGRPQK